MSGPCSRCSAVLIEEWRKSVSVSDWDALLQESERPANRIFPFGCLGLPAPSFVVVTRSQGSFTARRAEKPGPASGLSMRSHVICGRFNLAAAGGGSRMLAVPSRAETNLMTTQGRCSFSLRMLCYDTHTGQTSCPSSTVILPSYHDLDDVFCSGPSIRWGEGVQQQPES